MEYKEDYEIRKAKLKCAKCKQYLKTREYYVGEWEQGIICKDCFNKLPHKIQIIKPEIEIIKVKKNEFYYIKCAIHNCLEKPQYEIHYKFKNHYDNQCLLVCQKHRYDSTLFGEKIK